MDEPYERYCKIVNIVKELEQLPSLRPIEWFDEHYNFLEYYLENLGEYSELHPEITDPVFRQKCEDLEKLNDQLLMEYNIHRWFSLYHYLEFNKTLLWLIECDKDEYELCSIFKKL